MIVELGDLGLDEGAHLLVKRALAAAPRVTVQGSAENLAVDLPAWARALGHGVERSETGYVLTRGPDRWAGAERAGTVSAPVAHAPARWGLAARGALVEAGSPAFDLPLADRTEVWADEAVRLYAQAAASQWDPATAIPWDAPADHPPEVEDAIVQVMTYLIENETAALLVPTRFLARLHPHFREVMQLLAIQAADEARHIEVFTRRARLRRDELGLSTAGGQASSATLFDEPDFAVASFLVSVLGEGASSRSWVHPRPRARQARARSRGLRAGRRRHVAAWPRAPGAPHRGRARAPRSARGDRAPALGPRAHRRAKRRGVRCPAPPRGGLVGAGRVAPGSRRRRGPPARDGRRPPSAAGAPRLPGRTRGRALGAPHAQLHVTTRSCARPAAARGARSASSSARRASGRPWSPSSCAA